MLLAMMMHDVHVHATTMYMLSQSVVQLVLPTH